MNFPDNEYTVGFLVTEESTPVELEQMQRVIARLCADRVVVFSQQPFDVRNTSLWPTLIDLFDGLCAHFVAQSVTAEEMSALASDSRAANVSLLLPAMAAT